MIEGDVGEDGEERIDDVGGVETSSEADFEDGDVYGPLMGWAWLREVQKGECGEDLEEAGRVGKGAGFDEVPGGFVYLEVEAGKVFVGDGDAVDLDALVDADEVGRGVEAGAVASGREDAGEGSGGRAFAIGSGDQDRGKGLLRVSESGGEGAHVGEIELSPRRAGGRGREFMAKSVQMVDRCGVGHAAILGDRASYRRMGERLPFGTDGEGGMTRRALALTRWWDIEMDSSGPIVRNQQKRPVEFWEFKLSVSA
jgi:hypothetical protein